MGAEDQFSQQRYRVEYLKTAETRAHIACNLRQHSKSSTRSILYSDIDCGQRVRATAGLDAIGYHGN